MRFLFYSRRSSLLLAFFFFFLRTVASKLSAFFRARPHLFRSLSSFNPRARRDFSDMNSARPCDEYLNTGKTTSLSSHAELGLIILVRFLSKIIQLGRERENCCDSIRECTLRILVCHYKQVSTCHSLITSGRNR